jgi:ATP-dependent Clp protease adaptor protein ClpS
MGPFRKREIRYIRSMQTALTQLSHVIAAVYTGAQHGTAPMMMAQRPRDEGGDDTSILTKTAPKTARPPLYKVMLLNDDYTPMEFVVHVLERFFGLNHAQAFDIMLTVHKKGLAVVGVFSAEIAETKVAQVMDFARRHQHPLQCTMEKE